MIKDVVENMEDCFKQQDVEMIPMDQFTDKCPYRQYHSTLGSDRCDCRSYLLGFKPSLSEDLPETVGLGRQKKRVFTLHYRVMILVLKLIRIICKEASNAAENLTNVKYREIELEPLTADNRWRLAHIVKLPLANLITNPYADFMNVSSNNYKSAKKNIEFIIQVINRKYHPSELSSDRWKFLMYNPLYVHLLHMVGNSDYQHCLDTEAYYFGRDNALAVHDEFVAVIRAAEFKSYCNRIALMKSSKIPESLHYYASLDSLVYSELLKKYS